MSAFKVTMTPDTSGWAEDDLRWVAGFHLGLWKRCADEAEATAIGNSLAEKGWTVTIDPMEEK